MIGVFQQDLIDRVEYQAQAAQHYVGRVPKVLIDAKKKKIKSLKVKNCEYIVYLR